MSLNDFKPQFDNAYEEIFQKVLVAKEIMNTRFEALLTYGASVQRVAYDISGVLVRTVTRGSASTIDSITDTNETLTVNLEKEAVFHISDGEVKQAGPLNPGEVIGGQVAIKIGADLDARCFAEVVNANKTFDNGDLTTTASTGTGITLSSTTVPQMVTRMPAKLRANNITLTNMALVVDAYAASDIEQYLLGKQFNIVESVFMNGYAGPIATAEVYVSQNLMGEFKLTLNATGFSDGDTITINGVVFTAKTTPTTAGHFKIGGSGLVALTNLATGLATPSTTDANFIALSSADQTTILALGLSGTPVGTSNGSMVVRGTGSGRMTVTASSSNTAVTYNIFHAYYGKKGAIDLVLMDMKEVDMRPTSDRRGTNVFSSYLAGLKTFTDGSKKFLDVWINS